MSSTAVAKAITLLAPVSSSHELNMVGPTLPNAGSSSSNRVMTTGSVGSAVSTTVYVSVRPDGPSVTSVEPPVWVISNQVEAPGNTLESPASESEGSLSPMPT